MADDPLGFEIRDRPLALGSVLPLALVGLARAIRPPDPELGPPLVVPQSLDADRDRPADEQLDQVAHRPQALELVAQLVSPAARLARHRLTLRSDPASPRDPEA